MDTCGVFSLAEAVLCTYVDLDRLIMACGFTPEQSLLLEQLMDGLTLMDIAERDGLPFERIERRFRNMVARIVRQNNLQWTTVNAKSSFDRA